jgi:hypothetical protein
MSRTAPLSITTDRRMLISIAAAGGQPAVSWASFQSFLVLHKQGAASLGEQLTMQPLQPALHLQRSTGKISPDAAWCAAMVAAWAPWSSS